MQTMGRYENRPETWKHNESYNVQNMKGLLMYSIMKRHLIIEMLLWANYGPKHEWAMKKKCPKYQI